MGKEWKGVYTSILLRSYWESAELSSMVMVINAVWTRIISAATWPTETHDEKHNSFSPMCTCCNQSHESASHCFWKCPADENITDERVVSTQSLVEEAIADCEAEPCLWSRRIVTADKALTPLGGTPMWSHYTHPFWSWRAYCFWHILWRCFWGRTYQMSWD